MYALVTYLIRRAAPGLNGSCLLPALYAFCVCASCAAAEDATWAHCANGRTQVSGATSNELALICPAAEDAELFLQDCGLRLPGEHWVEIVRKSIELGGVATFGCFDAGGNVIRILDYAGCSEAAAKNEAYALLPADEFYKSIVIHEVAHQVFRHNLGKRKLSHAAHEYVAYAVQISLMPKAVRNRFLAPIRRSPPSDLSPFGDMLLLMAPKVFAAMAYDHFSVPGNACEALHGLIKGKQELQTWEEFD